jgi:hypothetical protein
MKRLSLAASSGWGVEDAFYDMLERYMGATLGGFF